MSYSEILEYPLRSALELSAGVAFLKVDRRIFLCKTSRKREPGEPSSPIVGLIQGVHQRYPASAMEFLRNRIYSTTDPTEMCLGMIKVAAKRLTAPIGPAEVGALLSEVGEYEEIEHGRDVWSQLPYSGFLKLPASEPQAPWVNDAAFLEIARSMLSQAPEKAGPRYLSDRPVAALLVSAGGEILAWGLNSGSTNKTGHAEVNLIQSFFRRTACPIPSGAKIYTTLKPCKMCAGMIWECAENKSKLEVRYLEDDPGPMGRSTVLDLGSAERLRAAGGDTVLLEAKVQRRI